MKEKPISLFEGLGSSYSGGLSEAVYFPPMDYILFLNQDTAYVTDRIDEWLTLLRDPRSETPIGVKLKGVHNLYLGFKSLWSAMGLDLEASIPFRKFISVAETAASKIGANAGMGDREREFVYSAYEIAKKIVGNLEVPAAELEMAKAA